MKETESMPTCGYSKIDIYRSDELLCGLSNEVNRLSNAVFTFDFKIECYGDSLRIFCSLPIHHEWDGKDHNTKTKLSCKVVSAKYGAIPITKTHSLVDSFSDVCKQIKNSYVLFIQRKLDDIHRSEAISACREAIREQVTGD